MKTLCLADQHQQMADFADSIYISERPKSPAPLRFTAGRKHFSSAR